MSRTLTVVAFFLLGLGVSAGMLIGKLLPAAPAPMPRAMPAVSPQVQELQNSFAEVSAFVSPSVVHITNRETNAMWWGPVDSVGSGVIVTDDGYILTNAHVVARARGGKTTRELIVRTYEDDEYVAAILGVDSVSDIAVIKIDAKKKLTPAVLGDSDKIRVGDWVLAIGSPFKLNHTVTAGIISAKSRRMGQNPSVYSDYLQTDAAINPGNSGGALVNIKGEVIGINTAILDVSNVYVGVGFAIPSKTAKWVMDRLIKNLDHKINRGYLGVGVMSINDDLVRTLSGSGDIESVDQLVKKLGLKSAEGAYVYMVPEESPAAKAGLREGDVILEIDRRKVRNSDELVFAIADTPPGSSVRVRFVREGDVKEIDVKLVAPPANR